MTDTKTTRTLPTLSEEKRAEALAKAAKVRTERAALLKEVKKGNVDATTLLDDDRDLVRRISVRHLIEALPGVGKAGATKIMEEIGIKENRRIGGLGSQQRDSLRERIASLGAR